MTEKTLQRLFVVFLQNHGIYHVKTISCSRAGVPDLICAIRGEFWAFELKSSKGKETQLQKYNGYKIMQSGGKYYIVTPDNYSSITDKIING